MKLLRGTAVGSEAGAVLTIGTFDGLHVGHQALVARALAAARERGLQATMLSFEPMPREFLKPQDPPARLTNFRERWRLLAGSGLDHLHLLNFNDALRQLSGLQFMQLLRRFGARHIVIGHDFRFGRNGEANAESCEAGGREFGFSVEVVPPVLVGAERASSGLVREALAIGDFAAARQLLGRPYAMIGRVRRGAQLGRTLGFPTANLGLERRRSPLAGVLAVRVRGPDLRDWPGVASLGTRPTVNGVEPLLEVHLFDFDRDLYGAELEVEFVAHLRPEQRFESLDTLVVQMQADARAARAALAAASRA